MSDFEADECIVRDVLNAAGDAGWRWTLDHPELRFRLPGTQGWTFRIDFGFPPSTFSETGPVVPGNSTNSAVQGGNAFPE